MSVQYAAKCPCKGRIDLLNQSSTADGEVHFRFGIMTLTATVSRTATHVGLLRPSRVTFRSPAPFRSIRGPGAVRMAKNSTLTVALSQDELKKQAAHKAVEYAKSGMVLGLGTGSTTAFAIDRIGELMKKGELKDIVGVPTSIKSYEQASGASASTYVLQTPTAISITCFSFVTQACKVLLHDFLQQ